eukprot:3276672-Amphidinium_carterae.1
MVSAYTSFVSSLETMYWVSRVHSVERNFSKPANRSSGLYSRKNHRFDCKGMVLHKSSMIVPAGKIMWVLQHKSSNPYHHQAQRLLSPVSACAVQLCLLLALGLCHCQPSDCCEGQLLNNMLGVYSSLRTLHVQLRRNRCHLRTFDCSFLSAAQDVQCRVVPVNEGEERPEFWEAC